MASAIAPSSIGSLSRRYLSESSFETVPDQKPEFAGEVDCRVDGPRQFESLHQLVYRSYFELLKADQLPQVLRSRSSSWPGTSISVNVAIFVNPSRS